MKKNRYSVIFLTILISIGVILSVANYSPGTWLSGWDTLHPEFDFPLAIKREISGVWRSEQGLGALSGHSDIAELPRILLLWLSSVVVTLT